MLGEFNFSLILVLYTYIYVCVCVCVYMYLYICICLAHRSLIFLNSPLWSVYREVDGSERLTTLKIFPKICITLLKDHQILPFAME